MTAHTLSCSKIDGRPIGRYGDLTMFSFHATKLFHTLRVVASSAVTSVSESPTNLDEQIDKKNALMYSSM